MKKVLPLIAVFLCLALAHPFYLGVCDLKYNEKEKALQGSVKLFLNDLEGALSRLNTKKTDLINIKDSVQTGKLLESYLNQRLKFEINGRKMTYTFVGFEREQEALWMYIEINNCPNPTNVLVTNTLLYDFLKGQMNIVHLEVGSQKKSLKIVNPEKELKFEF